LPRSSAKRKSSKSSWVAAGSTEWSQSGCKSIGRLCGAEVIGAKKRVLSAAGRAAIVKAAKKRWTKVRKQAKKVTG
jgi:hypothetical protein